MSLTLAAAAVSSTWFATRHGLPATGGIAGGAALGLGSFFLLERFVKGLSPGEVRFRAKAVLALSGVVAGTLALALLPGSVLWVLVGFSCYVGALVACAILEACHA